MSFFEIGSRAVMERQAWLAGVAAVLLVAYVFAGRVPAYARLSAAARRMLGRMFGVTLALVVAYGAVTYFYSSRHSGFTHRWDLFHTVTSVRFFDELEYTRLYQCALVFDSLDQKRLTRVRKMRDLRTLRQMPRREALSGNDCLERFSPERQQAFTEDLEFWWQQRPSRSRWTKLFRDKGYNGTPFYSTVVRALIGDGPLEAGRVRWLTYLDIALVLFALGCVAFAFGPAVGAFAALFFFVNFPGRFVHMGGSILRFDYVSYLMIGASLLHLKRYAGAGAVFALAAMTRGFPVLFPVALGLKAAFDTVVERRVAPRYWWFFGAFAATALACFVWSLSFGGLDAWRGFVDNIGLHTSRSAGFRIGFQHMFMMDGNLTGTKGFLGYFDKARLFADRKVLYWLAVASLVGPAVWLSRRMTDAAFLALGGLLLFFTLTVATRYYYAVLVLVFLAGYDVRRDLWYAAAWVASFALAAVGHVLLVKRVYVPFVYNTFFSSALLVFFVGLWAAVAWHHIRGFGAQRVPNAASGAAAHENTDSAAQS